MAEGQEIPGIPGQMGGVGGQLDDSTLAAQIGGGGGGGGATVFSFRLKHSRGNKFP